MPVASEPLSCELDPSLARSRNTVAAGNGRLGHWFLSAPIGSPLNTLRAPAAVASFWHPMTWMWSSRDVLRENHDCTIRWCAKFGPSLVLCG